MKSANMAATRISASVCGRVTSCSVTPDSGCPPAGGRRRERAPASPPLPVTQPGRFRKGLGGAGSAPDSAAATQAVPRGLGWLAGSASCGRGGGTSSVVLGSAFRILLLLLVALAAAPARAAPEHAIAMLSQPKYGPDFTHFDYADPNAPKGGTLTESAIGTFDNLNPYIVNGAAAAGLGPDRQHADGGLAGRALHRVRPARQDHRRGRTTAPRWPTAAAARRAGRTGSRSPPRT